MEQSPQQITRLLKEWSDCDGTSLDEMMPLVYEELRRQASRFLRVELCYFSGLSIDETGDVLGIPNSTVRCHWNMAKAWLHPQITK